MLSSKDMNRGSYLRKGSRAAKKAEGKAHAQVKTKTGRGPVRFILTPVDDDNGGEAIDLRVGVPQIIGRNMLRDDKESSTLRQMISREHILVQTRRAKGENEGRGNC